jgi:hypothetical protein
MPLYTFQHPDTEEVIDVAQSMTEKHFYIDENGVEWRRVWHNPNASVDTNIDPHSSKDFVEKTRNMKGTMGDLWDAAREAGEKRKKRDGEDKIQKKWFKEYSKGRKGIRHQQDPSRE